MNGEMAPPPSPLQGHSRRTSPCTLISYFTDSKTILIIYDAGQCILVKRSQIPRYKQYYTVFSL